MNKEKIFLMLLSILIFIFTGIDISVFTDGGFGFWY